MCLLFESIKLENGQFCRLSYHQQRVHQAFELLFPESAPVCLAEVLSREPIPQEGTFKCRLVYGRELQSVNFIPYVGRQIKSLRLVETELSSFPYKQEERAGFQLAFDQRGDCDDVILVRNGLLTDTSYSNIALFDGRQWVTPATPLLFGTNRAALLEQGMLVAADIGVSELRAYSKICLFNAMVEFGELVLAIDAIVS